MDNKKESLKQVNDIRKKFLQEGKNLVWHGMNLKNFEQLIDNNFRMQAFTTQRYWQDGKLRKDNAPDYNDSFWYHGWSLSRSKVVSSSFGEILWAMDLNEIKKEFKTIPISWNFTIRNNTKLNHKKEQEEFVIAHKGKYSLEFVARASNEYQERIDEIHDILHDNNNLSERERNELIREREIKEEFFDKNWFKEILEGPKGKEMDINRFTAGFFIIPKNINDEKLIAFKDHPMCLGVLNLEEINIDEYNRIQNLTVMRKKAM